jgi:hypothetical protein
MDTFTSVILNFGTYLAQRPASGRSRLHTAAHQLAGKITEPGYFHRSQGLTCGFRATLK